MYPLMLYTLADHPAPLTMHFSPPCSSHLTSRPISCRHARIRRNTQLTPLTHEPNPTTGHLYLFGHDLRIDPLGGNDFMLDDSRCSTQGLIDHDHERVSSSPFSCLFSRTLFRSSCDGQLRQEETSTWSTCIVTTKKHTSDELDLCLSSVSALSLPSTISVLI